MQLRGEWSDAMAEVRRACEHLSYRSADPVVVGMRGTSMPSYSGCAAELTRAEETYRPGFASPAGHALVIWGGMGRGSGSPEQIAATVADFVR
jgi:hypothetical protein